jgi:hypothetical protein
MHPLGPRGPLPLPAPLLPPKPELVRAWNELCQKVPDHVHLIGSREKQNKKGKKNKKHI